MKKIICLGLFLVSLNSYALDISEKRCIEAKVALREKVENTNFDGFFNIIPNYKDVLLSSINDPYSCSLAK
jgi:hypothetical protein